MKESTSLTVIILALVLLTLGIVYTVGWAPSCQPGEGNGEYIHCTASCYAPNRPKDDRHICLDRCLEVYGNTPKKEKP